VNLIHPEHPPADPKLTFRATAIRPPGGSLSERRMDHFPSGAPNYRRLHRLKEFTRIAELPVAFFDRDDAAHNEP